MDTQTFIQTVIYPALALLITTGVGFAVVYIKSMAATAQAAADAAALAGALARGKALADAHGGSLSEAPGIVAKYLATTSPELAVRTGVGVLVDPPGTSNADVKVLVPTLAGAARIAATVATPLPVAP